MKKRKGYKAFWTLCLVLAAAVVLLAYRLLGEMRGSQKIYQQVTELGRLTYDESLLEELQKLPGLLGVFPVSEVPVKLRLDGFTMDATLTGVELSELELKAAWAQETSVTEVPVLLLGSGALAGMKDDYGHELPEHMQKKYLQYPETIALEYQTLESGEGESSWHPCRVAAILSEPAQEIYIPYEQAQRLAKEKKVTKVLLRRRGIPCPQTLEELIQD